MLASQLLRRIVPAGAGLDLDALGSLDVAADVSAATFDGAPLVTAGDVTAAVAALAAALASVAFSGSASDLGAGTLPIARIGDGTITQAKLAAFLAAVATSGSASDLGAGTLPIARIGDGTVTQAKLAAFLAAVATSGSASDLGAGTLPIARLSGVSAALYALVHPELTGQGIIAETFPRNCRGSTTGALVSGTIYFTGMPLFAGQSIANITVLITVASTGATLAKVGLYDSAGNLLRASATQHVSWNGGATQKATVALTSAFVVVTDGYYYAAVISVGGTGPTLICGPSSASSNSPLATAIGSGKTAISTQTGQTDLTNPAAISTTSSVAFGIWQALS